MRKELAALIGFFVIGVTPLRADVAILSADGFRHGDPAAKERAKKARGHGGIHGLATTKKTSTGAVQLIDSSGLKFFINTNITFSTSSSASAAASEASFTASVAASTSAGGTTSYRLNDMYDGYNAMCVSLTGATGPCQTGNASYTSYNKNGPAAVDTSGSCTGADVNRQYVYPPKTIGSLSVQRKVFVPSDDNFIRWMNIFTNTGASPVTFNMITSNNLGSDAATIITGTSTGTIPPTTADKWVTTFQNWSSGTSTDPRSAHVLWDGIAPVGPSTVFFANGNDRPYWTYTITLAPGQTGRILNYSVGTGFKAASAAKAAVLSTEPLPATAVGCLSVSEQAEVLNYTLLPATDVAITKTAAPTSANPGDTVTFGLSVTNTGAAASGVSVSDTLPAGLTYASNSCGGTFSGGTFTWAIGAMANGGSASCNLLATVGAVAAGTVLTNTATVSELNPDSTPANNTSSASVTVLGPADLSIAKTTASGTVTPGQSITWNLTAANAGPNAAQGVVVSDTLPAGTTYVSNTCGATLSGGTLTWNVGTLASGGSAACSVVVTAGATVGTITNTASISGTNTDPATANNTASSSVTAAAPTQIPTLGGAGLLALGGALALAGMLLLRRSS